MANNVNVTNRGFEYLSRFISGASTGFSVPSFIGWGGANGYNSASVLLPASAASSTQGTGQWSDVAPFQEFSEARVPASSTAVTASVGSGTTATTFVGTITASTGENVAESFLGVATFKPSAFTLSGNQTSTSAVAITVSTAGAALGYYQFNNEVVQLTATAPSNVWTITRGANGSVAGTAKTGDVITFGNVPGATSGNPGAGDIFAHAGFQSLALNTSDSVQFTWVVNVTS